MANVSYLKELWTDGITAAGVARDVSFRALVVFDDGSEEWHYWGSAVAQYPPPGAAVAVEHNAVHFPADMLALPEANNLLFDLAIECLFRKLATATV